MPYMNYLYTTCFGTFVFDQDLNLVDKRYFDDVLEANKTLSKKEMTKQEQEMTKLYPINVFVGYKKEMESSIDKWKEIQSKFSSSQFFSPNVKITKQAIKDSVTDDQLIIQTITTIETLNRAISRLSKRIREWYGYYNPETSQHIKDHEAFVREITEKTREQLLEESGHKDTMGGDLKENDKKPIIELAKNIKNLYTLKQSETDYLEEKMQIVCPNMTAITGALIGAKLLSQAGSLRDLAIMPSSTVQLLGAEKALFRHLTRHTLPPKYGILHEHPLISSAPRSMHGKIARTLADKISIASRVDYFKGDFIGDKLYGELEEKFK